MDLAIGARTRRRDHRINVVHVAQSLELPRRYRSDNGVRSTRMAGLEVDDG